MAPSFEQLDPETEYDDGDDEIDYTGMWCRWTRANSF